MVGWLVVSRIYVDLAVFQPYLDLEAGDNQSLKLKWQGGESNPGPLAPQAKSLTTRPKKGDQGLLGGERKGKKGWKGEEGKKGGEKEKMKFFLF